MVECINLHSLPQNISPKGVKGYRRFTLTRTKQRVKGEKNISGEKGQDVNKIAENKNQMEEW